MNIKELITPLPIQDLNNIIHEYYDFSSFAHFLVKEFSRVRYNSSSSILNINSIAQDLNHEIEHNIESLNSHFLTHHDDQKILIMMNSTNTELSDIQSLTTLSPKSELDSKWKSDNIGSFISNLIYKNHSNHRMDEYHGSSWFLIMAIFGLGMKINCNSPIGNFLKCDGSISNIYVKCGCKDQNNYPLFRGTKGLEGARGCTGPPSDCECEIHLPLRIKPQYLLVK